MLIAQIFLLGAVARHGGAETTSDLHSFQTSPIFVLQIFLIGALAKLGATVVTYPLLLIKSRLMSQSKSDAEEHCYSGTIDALMRIYKNDGELPPIRSDKISCRHHKRVLRH